MTKLSVIIPCYNCADTIGDAVASVVNSEVGIPFDLTMVDDGSTDHTPARLADLAKRHQGIRLVRHQVNRGGGAARNSGIAASDGDLIFCLDADDMLAPDFLDRMVQFWKDKHCDAVGMSTSIKFKGSDVRDVEYVSEFAGPGRPVRFESFLDGSPCSLSVVFMMTRRAFKLVGGYPTEHGFDTQGMGFRFLCNGLRAFTCPGTTYYHRVGRPSSYYMREQSAGRVNWNWLNVVDEFLYLFHQEVRHELLSTDVFDDQAGRSPVSVREMLKSGVGIYAPGYKRLVRIGPRAVAREFSRSSSSFHRYWLGNYHRLRGAYRRSLAEYTRALEGNFRYRLVYYHSLDSLLRLSADGTPTPQKLAALAHYCRPYPDRLMTTGHRLYRFLLASKALWPLATAGKHFGELVRGRRRE
jgi:glycosyltransferase involved in cell wall biosynthesis